MASRIGALDGTGAGSPGRDRESEMAYRGLQLLGAGRGITTRYAVAAVDAGLVEEDELRGHGKPVRWYLA